jgi:hypothetical protein
VKEDEVIQQKKHQKEQDDIKHLKEFIASAGTYANLVKQIRTPLAAQYQPTESVCWAACHTDCVLLSFSCPCSCGHCHIGVHAAIFPTFIPIVSVCGPPQRL